VNDGIFSSCCARPQDVADVCLVSNDGDELLRIEVQQRTTVLIYTKACFENITHKHSILFLSVSELGKPFNKLPK